MCGDSSTIIQTEGGEVYAWGRGFSKERKVDVSRFKPKMLDSLELHHAFLLPRSKDEEENKEVGTYTSNPVVVNLDRNITDQFQPKIQLQDENPVSNRAD